MGNKKEYCENLYKKWKDLKKDIESPAEDLMESKGKIKGKVVTDETNKAIEEYEEIKMELKNKCKFFISPEQQFELEEN